MYILLKGNEEIKKFDEASCFTEALCLALEELGYRVEAADCEGERVALSFNDQTAVLKPPSVASLVEKPIEDTKVAKKVVPFTGKALEMYHLLKTGPHTREQLIEKLGIAPATVKTNLGSLFPRNGVTIKQDYFPGAAGMLFSIE